MCSSRVAQHMNWDTIDDLHDSDHFPIKISYQDSTPLSPTTQPIPQRNLKKINWHNYKIAIATNL